MRIIVTGCRDWRWPELVNAALDYEYLKWQEAYEYEEGEAFIVVHGACPTGADHFASEWADYKYSMNINCKVKEDPHPANWDKYNKRAGPVRNGEMAAAGADLCLAFWDATVDGSGTHDMIVQAVQHNILTMIVPAPEKIPRARRGILR